MQISMHLKENTNHCAFLREHMGEKGFVEMEPFGDGNDYGCDHDGLLYTLNESLIKHMEGGEKRCDSYEDEK